MRAVLWSLLLVLPVFAGCLGGEETPTAEAPPVAQSAEDAGAKAGDAPVAASEPYQVTLGAEGSDAQVVTAYPVALQTNAAKPPVTLEFPGEFDAASCNPLGGLPFGGLGLAQSFHFNDLSESLAKGDVLSYAIEMRYTNTEQSWAELHLFYGMDTTQDYWQEPTGDKRGEVVMNFTGQSYRVDDEAPAWAAAACWYGAVTTPIPYTLTVTITFAQGSVPSGAPMLLEVPQGASRLFVSGVPLDPAEGVNSHYRVFGPDDLLVCECGLSSSETSAALVLPGPGAYVVLVDHTANGFVSFALDAPPAAPLTPLEAEWVVYPLHAAEGGPVDATVDVDLPSTPLSMNVWVFPPGFTEGVPTPDAGMGKGVGITITNGRGEVARTKLGGYVAFHAGVPGAWMMGQWIPVALPGAEWEFFVDHHAYGPGAHQVAVKAEQMRGEAVLFAQHYVRGSARGAAGGAPPAALRRATARAGGRPPPRAAAPARRR